MLVQVLVGTLFAVLLLEVVVRIADPFDTLEFIVDDELLWRYRPNQIGRVAEYGVLKHAPLATINGSGFRGRDLLADDRSPRVLFLGDSATFGSGVGDAETYSALVQGMARDCTLSVNAGTPGWGVFQYEALLHRMARELLARLVIVDLGAGQTTQRQPFATDAEREAYLRPRRLLNAIRKYSHLALFVGRRLHRLSMMLTERRVPTETGEPDRFYAHLEANIQRLASMRDLVASQGGELALVVWPRRSFPQNEAFVQAIRKWGSTTDVTIIDLTVPLSALDEWQWRIPTDWHPNALGHRIAAHEIFEMIIRRAPQTMLDCDRPMPS